MPAVVGAVSGVRAFGSDADATGDRGMLLLFAALLVAFGMLALLPAAL
jgi:hypothetical protein